MDVRVEAPDLRGTIVLVALTLTWRRGLHIQGSVEIQPTR
jgi:hypothetical protein